MTNFTVLFHRRAVLLAAVVLATALATPSIAAEPAVIERLASEPTTLFDMGMKRLRSLALEATLRITAPSDQATTSRVWYRTETKSIEIRFELRVSAQPIGEPLCRETQTRVINETFSIGRTAYLVNLSRAERVRRRLGLIFAHEPIESGKDAIAIGERLAELTFVEIAYLDRLGAVQQSCRISLAVSERQ